MGQRPKIIEAAKGFTQRGLPAQTYVTAIGASCFSPPLVVGLTAPEQGVRVLTFELLFGHAFYSRFRILTLHYSPIQVFPLVLMASTEVGFVIPI
jgi:hypothetical protein